MSIESLYTRAETLAGRPVEVDKTQDGKFIVLWMCFGKAPPAKAETEEGALQNFIDLMDKSAASAVELPPVEG